MQETEQAIARLQKEIKMIRQQLKEHIVNSNNNAKKHNNKIDAAAWSLCNYYKLFKFDSNGIKCTENIIGLIFGNRVLNTYYELTARYDKDGSGSGYINWFCLGIADASYKNKSSFGSG